MKFRLFAIILSLPLLTSGCENMRQLSDTIEELNKALLPLTLFKKSGN